MKNRTKSSNAAIYELAAKTEQKGRNTFSARVAAADWRNVYQALNMRGWRAIKQPTTDKAPRYFVFTAYRKDAEQR